jgi:hypothetical protein
MIENITKKKELLSKYRNFLKEHIVQKGENINKITHTMFGEINGSYNIQEEDEEEFFECYCNLLGKVELNMIERPLEVGPLLFDLDFKFSEKYEERQYDEEDIKNIISCINAVILKYINKPNKREMKSFIFEKDGPSIKEKTNEYKDGVHIMYPYLPLDVNMRYIIIEEAKKKVIDGKYLEHLPINNDINKDIFDIAVVIDNGWVMYGSGKHNSKVYKLTHVYKYDLENDEKELGIPAKELVKKLSNRKFKDESKKKDHY